MEAIKGTVRNRCQNNSFPESFQRPNRKEEKTKKGQHCHFSRNHGLPFSVRSWIYDRTLSSPSRGRSPWASRSTSSCGISSGMPCRKTSSSWKSKWAPIDCKSAIVATTLQVEEIMYGAVYVAKSQSQWWKVLAPHAIGTHISRRTTSRAFVVSIDDSKRINQNIHYLALLVGLGCKMVRRGFRSFKGSGVSDMGSKILYVSSST